MQLSLDSTFTWSFSGDGEKGPIVKWLEGYAEKRSNLYPLPLEALTHFQRRVLQTLQKVPFGSTMSYGNLAREIGNPKAARAIGGACHNNPFPLLIPCHRVISADGSLGGFATDLEIKRRLLNFELN